MPGRIVRPTSTYAIVVTLAVIALAACGASDPDQESAPARDAGSLATPTAAPPTIDSPTPDVPTAPGIGLDPATAAETLVQLVDPLDEPEYYCVDVPGFGASLNLGSALTAHTCKPGADDEMFAVDRPGPGNLYMPAYDLCLEADGTEAPAQLYLRVCYDGALQQFAFDSDGALVLSGAGLCMAVSAGAGEPTGGPSHLRRDLVLVDCGAAEPALKQWTFPGRSPR